MPGTWSTSSPTIVPGAYWNFVNAAQVAVQTGTNGVAAVVGTADWGPVGTPKSVGSQGEYEQNFGAGTAGTLRDGALGALDGFDLGGSTSVLAHRIAGSAAAFASLVLDDGSAADALTLTALYKGARANLFTVTVQTNADDASNKDLILYESGVELQRWTNVTGGTNTAFAAAITASNSKYVTAAITGSGARALANITSGAAGTTFAGGDSGTTITVSDVSAALTILGQQEWNAIALSNVSDDTILDAFATFVKNQNSQTNRRCFGIVAGAAAETLLGTAPSAQARSAEYDSANIVNLSVDLKRLSDGVVLSSAQIAPRYAGALAGIALRRSMTYVTWTGYQVNNPLTFAQLEPAINAGINIWSNHSVTAVRLENAVTTLVTTNSTDRPAAHKQIRNVATDHFIQRTIDERLKQDFIGKIANTEVGRRDMVTTVLAFLEVLEDEGVLQSGGSTVELDERYVQDGSTNAVYLVWEYSYANAIERIFSTVRVK